MNNLELKRHLEETWPLRPGQEARAWAALHTRIGGRTATAPGRFAFPFRFVAAGGALTAVVLVTAYLISPAPAAGLSAASQSPGIFATAFYSKPARAQVVWLNGLSPANDGPTYMDPTTEVEAEPVPPDHL